jgi:hypothetical protein
MATWKELRALQAAQQAAEAQRETEARRGQREAQTWQQVLGTVDQLIGMAPQAIGAYETGEAQKVLAGERPLEREKPKDVLEGIAQFISSPFEGGVQRRAKAMAGEMAPAELAKLQPLTTQAVQQRLAEGAQPLDTREARKQISPEEFEKRLGRAMPVEAAARGVLERSPALRLLPEREREAMAAGETQRVQAEQAAAASDAELRQAQLDKLRAETTLKISQSEAKATKVSPQKRAELAAAIAGDVRTSAQKLQQNLASTDPAVRSAAIDTLNDEASLAAATLRTEDGQPLSPDSTIVRAAAGEAVANIMKELELPPLNETAQAQLAVDKDTIKKVADLWETRKKVGFSLEEEQIIGRTIMDNANNVLGVPQILKALQDAGLKATLTAEQNDWLAQAMVIKNRLTTQEFKGTGAISDFERKSVLPFVLNPFSTEAQFDQRARSTIKDISSKFVNKVNSYKKLNRFDDEIIKFSEDLESALGQNDYNVLYGLLSQPSLGAKETMMKGEDTIGSVITGGMAEMISPVSQSLFEVINFVVDSMPGTPQAQQAAAVRNQAVASGLMQPSADMISQAQQLVSSGTPFTLVGSQGSVVSSTSIQNADQLAKLLAAGFKVKQ